MLYPYSFIFFAISESVAFYFIPQFLSFFLTGALIASFILFLVFRTLVLVSSFFITNSGQSQHILYYRFVHLTHMSLSFLLVVHDLFVVCYFLYSVHAVTPCIRPFFSYVCIKMSCYNTSAFFRIFKICLYILFN